VDPLDPPRGKTGDSGRAPEIAATLEHMARNGVARGIGAEFALHNFGMAEPMRQNHKREGGDEEADAHGDAGDV